MKADELELPAIPPGWEWTSLQSVVSVEANSLTDGPFGSKLKTAHYVDDGVRVVRLGNIGAGFFKYEDEAYITEEHFGSLRKHEVFPGDLLIAALAEPVGRSCRVPDNIGTAIVKADCIRCLPHPNISTDFLMHWLNSPSARRIAEDNCHGIGRLRINMGNIRALPIAISPAKEQRRIVAKIDALQARSRRAREALEALPALLDRFRQSVLAAAFRGDLTAQWRAEHPEVEPASVLLQRIRAERKARWIEAQAEKARARAEAKATKAGKPWTAKEDAATLKRERAKATTKYTEPEPVDPVKEGLPKLPAGWLWVAIEEVTERLSYGTSTKSRPSGTIPVLRMGNMQRGELDWSDLVYTSDPGEIEKYALSPNTVLFNRTNSPELVGKTSLFRGERPAICAGYIVSIHEIQGLSPPYLSWTLNSPYGRSWCWSAKSDGVSQSNISASKLARMPIPLPPAPEQGVIVHLVEAAFERERSINALYSQSSDAMVRLDQSILAKAFRGELVPQDPSDEPASELLKRIQAERAAAEATKPKRGRKKKSASKKVPDKSTKKTAEKTSARAESTAKKQSAAKKTTAKKKTAKKR